MPRLDMLHCCSQTASPSAASKYLHDLLSANNLPNLLLVAVGVVGTVIAIITLLKIERQTTASEKAANAAESAATAALQNAQYLVNSERPWLIAEVEKDTETPDNFHIRIKNYGRTPARLLFGDMASVFAEQPDMLSTPPEYKAPFVLPQQLLIVTDKGFRIPHGFNIPFLITQPNAVTKTLVIFGRVVYEDTIIPGVQHETRWCYGYSPTTRGGEFILTGPNEYTKNS